MAAFDTNRSTITPAGFAGHIGQTFVAMTAFDAAPTQSRPTLFDRIGQRLSHISALIADWQLQRSTRTALKGLSDRELDDIGLSRADLDTLR